MVQRPIVIASNQRHKSGPLLSVELETAKGSKERWFHQESNPGPLA